MAVFSRDCLLFNAQTPLRMEHTARVCSEWRLLVKGLWERPWSFEGMWVLRIPVPTCAHESASSNRMTSALSAALKGKPKSDQNAGSAFANSLRAPQKAVSDSEFDLSSIPLPPSAFPGLYQSSSAEDDFVAELDSLALSTSLGTQPYEGSFKSRGGTPVVSKKLLY